MKTVLTSYSFSPTNKTLDLSSIPDFDLRRLEAVIHQPTGKLLYALATPSLRAAATATQNGIANALITLTPDLTGMSTTDPLTIFYDATGFIVQQTYPQIRAFLPEDNFGPGGANSSIVQIVASTRGLRRLAIRNNGPGDAELWFGAAPAASLPGQFPPLGYVLEARGGKIDFDGNVPAGPIYATANSATLLSILTGTL